MDKVLRYFGIARKAGFLELGEENVGAAVRGGKARVVFLASDASDNARRRAEGYVHGRQMPLLRLPCSKEEISLATGKGGCSMAALTDVGLACCVLDALAGADPEQYAQTAADMAVKREKMDRRRAEAHAHERNKKTGKRRSAT